MKCFKYFLFSILSTNTFISGAQYLISEPSEVGVLNEVRQELYNQSEKWTVFRSKNWHAVWDEALGTPHRAWGKPIKIPGFSSINDGNVIEASKVFLESFQSLAVEFQDLKVIRTLHKNSTWYVTFQQYHEGLPVLFSRIELRISDNATVGLFGIDYHENIDFKNGRDLTKNEFVSRLELNKSPEELKAAILPIKGNGKISYHKIFEYIEEGSHSFYDAKTTELLWQKRSVCHAFSGVASGLIQEELSTDPSIDASFSHLYYTIDGETFVTGPDGEFEIDIQAPANLEVSLRGPFAEIINASQENALIEKTINPDEEVTIKWDDTNSTKAERNAFYHLNIAHDTLKALDPDYTHLDYSLPVNVNRVPANCNAFYNQVSINFDLEGGGCVSGADIAMVVYHEYGHAIIDKLFIDMGFPQGYISRPADEAQADVFSTMIEDSPIFAPGFFGPGTSTRNLTTFKRFPTDVDSSSPHQTGLILSGAFWDLRRRTSPEFVNRLAHFAKYGAPDGFNVGTVFRDWFIETLVADDDDNDLSNGTPNFEDINWAFELHGINVPGIVDGVLAIDNPSVEFNVYPNPSAGTFEVDLSSFNSNFELIISDLTGKIIWQKSSNETDIDKLQFEGTPGLSGILMVSVLSDGKVHTEKVIISKTGK